MSRRKIAGGDTLRAVENVKGSTQGKRAQSAVSATQTSLKRKPRTSASMYLRPNEIGDATHVQTTKNGKHVKMIVYRREG